MKITNLDEQLSEDKVTIVDFYADWCGPCKVLGPILEEVKSDLGEEVEILKIDVDKNTELASRYGIRGIPTMLFFKSGKVERVLSGAQPKEEIIKIVEEIK